MPVATPSHWDGIGGAWVTGFEFNLPTQWDDASLAAQHLTPDGAPVLAGSGGKWTSEVATFDGASLLFRDDASLLIPTDKGFSVTAWVWLNNLADAHTILAKRDATEIEYELSFDPAARRFQWLLNQGGSLYTYRLVGAVTAGRWYHVGIVMRPSRIAGVFFISPFINGVGVNATGPVVPRAVTSGHTFFIGGSFGGYLKGKLADVCLWTRELTAADMLALNSTSIVNLLSPTITAAASGAGYPGYPVTSAPATAPTSVEVDESGARPVLSWITENVNSLAVEIQRDDGFGFVTVGNVLNANEFTDAATELPGTASYRVRSVNMFGVSPWSVTVTLGAAGLIIDGEGAITDGEGTISDGET